MKKRRVGGGGVGGGGVEGIMDMCLSMHDT